MALLIALEPLSIASFSAQSSTKPADWLQLQHALFLCMKQGQGKAEQWPCPGCGVMGWHWLLTASKYSSALRVRRRRAVNQLTRWRRGVRMRRSGHWNARYPKTQRHRQQRGACCAQETTLDHRASGGYSNSRRACIIDHRRWSSFLLSNRRPRRFLGGRGLLLLRWACGSPGEAGMLSACLFATDSRYALMPPSLRER